MTRWLLKGPLWALLILVAAVVLLPAAALIVTFGAVLVLLGLVAAFWALVLLAEQWIDGEPYSYPEALADSLQQLFYGLRMAVAR